MELVGHSAPDSINGRQFDFLKEGERRWIKIKKRNGTRNGGASCGH